MNKSELIDTIAAVADESKNAVETVFNETFNQLTKLLKAGEKFTIPGFGTFKVSDRPERTGRNPQTGESMIIPAAKVAKFTPAKGLKEAIN